MKRNSTETINNKKKNVSTSSRYNKNDILATLQHDIQAKKHKINPFDARYVNLTTSSMSDMKHNDHSIASSSSNSHSCGNSNTSADNTFIADNNEIFSNISIDIKVRTELIKAQITHLSNETIRLDKNHDSSTSASHTKKKRKLSDDKRDEDMMINRILNIREYTVVDGNMIDDTIARIESQQPMDEPSVIPSVIPLKKIPTAAVNILKMYDIQPSSIASMGSSSGALRHTSISIKSTLSILNSSVNHHLLRHQGHSDDSCTITNHKNRNDCDNSTKRYQRLIKPFLFDNSSTDDDDEEAEGNDANCDTVEQNDDGYNDNCYYDDGTNAAEHNTKDETPHTSKKKTASKKTTAAAQLVGSHNTKVATPIPTYSEIASIRLAFDSSCKQLRTKKKNSRSILPIATDIQQLLLPTPKQKLIPAWSSAYKNKQDYFSHPSSHFDNTILGNYSLSGKFPYTIVVPNLSDTFPLIRADRVAEVYKMVCLPSAGLRQCLTCLLNHVHGNGQCGGNFNDGYDAQLLCNAMDKSLDIVASLPIQRPTIAEEDDDFEDDDNYADYGDRNQAEDDDNVNADAIVNTHSYATCNESIQQESIIELNKEATAVINADPISATGSKSSSSCLKISLQAPPTISLPIHTAESSSTGQIQCIIRRKLRCSKHGSTQIELDSKEFQAPPQRVFAAVCLLADEYNKSHSYLEGKKQMSINVTGHCLELTTSVVRY